MRYYSEMQDCPEELMKITKKYHGSHEPEAITMRLALHAKGIFGMPSEETIEELSNFLNKNAKGLISLGADAGIFENYLAGELAIPLFAIDKSVPKNGMASIVDTLDFLDKIALEKYIEDKQIDTVFLSWPYMGFNISPLAQLQPKYVIYIGEDEGGCTGSEQLFRYFDKAIDSFDISYEQWGGMFDRCTIYQMTT